MSSKKTIDDLNNLRKNTLMETLGIEFIEVTEDTIKAKMPVDHRTHQPFGLLHGGASAALAESLGSAAALLYLPDDKVTVGVELNANHIRVVKSGFVTATGKPLHIGKTTMVWEIKIEDENQRLICVSRLTMVVIDKK